VAGQRLGQNFLSDPAWRERIAALLRVRADEVWVEIGAGHGEMTEYLAAKAAQVTAIELDPPLVARLRERAATWPNVRVAEGDVLSLDLAAIAGVERFRVYGNLPYYITSPILHMLFASAARIASAHVVMQLEVAERVVAAPGRRDYGYLSVAAQYFARPEITLKIPPGAFRPAPKVWSALVTLQFPGAAAALGMDTDGRSSEAQAFLAFVQRCFAQKRKTLANNLRAMLGCDELDSGGSIAEVLRAAEIPVGARAEELSVEELVRLYRIVTLRRTKERI
jgi:16S rRNA (adenine1518-N6/adenine1519-N6)-dimethyltransferase